MSLILDSLFLSHPDPMWIYDMDSLRFLSVNRAAIEKYGYSTEEFLEMTIADIRPAEDRAALVEHVARVYEGQDLAGVWRHCLRSGAVIHVDITGHKIAFEGYRAELIAARDVTQLVLAKRQAKEALARETIARKSSETIALQLAQGACPDLSELMQARQHAEHLSQQLMRTFESIRDGFFTLDRQWRFTLINTEATRMLAMERDCFTEQIIWDLFPRLEESTFGRKYKLAMRTGEVQRFEAFSEDTGRSYDVAAFPSDEGLAVYFCDVTVRLREQQQLRLLNAAVSNLNDLVVITEASALAGPDHPKIVYVNDAFERRTGFSREEAIGRTPRMLQGPKTQLAELARIRSALEAKGEVRAELINYTKTGQEYWLETDIVPIIDAGGEVTHFVAIQRDITSRKLGEEALSLSEARFRLIANATGIAVWEWQIAGGRHWWSNGLTEIFGHLPLPIGTFPTVWRRNVHSEDEARVDAAMNGLLAGETDIFHERYRFRRANGSWAKVEDRAFLIRDVEGRALRVLGSMTDISERLDLEERLRQSQKLEAVGQLTGGVAHDFNNLLTIIIGNTEMLQDGLGPTHALRPFADMSAKAADRAAELTKRLLAFSRQLPLQPRVVDVNEVIVDLQGLLCRTLGEDIEIRITLAEGIQTTEVDAAQLEAAILNLAINARDAMPSGGLLTIETGLVRLEEAESSADPGLQAGLYILVSVKDTGHGIAKEDLGRVFEPFYTTKAVGKGTGLGLSMVYGFLKQSGGGVKIDSDHGAGTVVRLFFPASSDATAVVSPATGADGVPGGRETVLIVEDDEMILQQLQRQLVSLGYRVISASSGEPALEILRKTTGIDLLLTDVILPGGMNGAQIAAAAQAMLPELRVLFTSGYSENAIMDEGRLTDGVELLSKPYRRSELAAKLRKVLES